MGQLSFEGFTDRHRLLSDIRNLYCRLRFCRPWDVAKRRKLYRDIAKIKAVLLADGIDQEWLRLYCRQLASLDRAAMARFEAYSEKFSADLQKFLSA